MEDRLYYDTRQKSQLMHYWKQHENMFMFFILFLIKKELNYGVFLSF